MVNYGRAQTRDYCYLKQTNNPFNPKYHYRKQKIESSRFNLAQLWSEAHQFPLVKRIRGPSEPHLAGSARLPNYSKNYIHFQRTGSWELAHRGWQSYKQRIHPTSVRLPIIFHQSSRIKADESGCALWGDSVHAALCALAGRGGGNELSRKSREFDP